MKKSPTKHPKIPGQVRLPGWQGSFTLYLADLPGQGPQQMAKVGFVHREENIRRRVRELKSAAMLYFPVPLAAFRIAPAGNRTPQHAEGCVHAHLRDSGIRKSGEIFITPNACAQELIGEIHDALRTLGRSFEPVDVQSLTCHFRHRNDKIQAGLDTQRKAVAECPYEAFRVQYDPGGESWRTALDWSIQQLQEVFTLSFLLGDLYAGSGHPCLVWDISGFGRLLVFPPLTLGESHFEARAEQQLLLPSTGRTRVTVRASDHPSSRPIAAQVISTDICGLSIPGPFEAEESTPDSKVRFRAEHLACMGDPAVIPVTGSHYFAAGTRASLPPEVFALVAQQPEMFPAVRFLVGVMEALRRDIRLQDYALPKATRLRMDRLPEASELLAKAGHSIPESVVRWIMCTWVSGEEDFDARLA